MSKKVFGLALIVVCSLPLAGIQTSSARAGQSFAKDEPRVMKDIFIAESEFRPLDKSLLIPRDPIYINRNENFTSSNGVVSGNGTKENPYIIEGWEIDASSANGIDIRNTNVFFVIKDCIIFGGYWNAYDGIYFYSVDNGGMDNIKSYLNSHGIFLEHSSHNFITNCNINDTRFNGIVLSYSSNNTILNCTTYNTSIGASDPTEYVDDRGAGSITLKYSSSNNLIKNCTSYNNHYDGIFITGSSNNNLIIDSVAFDTPIGGGFLLRFSSCFNRIVNCTAYRNAFGYLIRQSSNNNLLENSTSSFSHFAAGFSFTDGNILNNTIVNCTSHNDVQGIWVSRDRVAINNTIINFTAYNDGVGILITSNYNNFRDCKLYNNNVGIRLSSALGNNINNCTLYCRVLWR